MSCKYFSRITQISKRAFLSCAFLAICAGAAWAENAWIDYQSITGLFRVTIPNEYKDHFSPFRIDDTKVLHSGELIATIDQRPYKNAVKNYIVKLDQTLGPNMSGSTKEKLINRELDFYQSHYESIGGVVKDRSTLNTGTSSEGEVYIAYPDKNFGKQGIIFRVVYTDVSRFQQILSGPEHVIYDKHSKIFIDSLDTAHGVTSIKKPIEEEWSRIKAPSGAFALLLPKTQPPYLAADPYVHSSGNTDIIGALFYDPVRFESIFYNAYGYRFGTKLTFSNAAEILLKKHIFRHKGYTRNVNIEKIYIGEQPALRARYAIPASEEYPYANTARLEAVFTGNYILVHEIISSPSLVDAPLLETIINHTEFDPIHGVPDKRPPHKDKK
ncbi:MAG: hypothetical protein KDJ75_01675 [Alphaproteobacteria bacterium]|nr:hypothetical protein [Alphaproteobacteria bacterium]